jgi:hypothetical protein
MFPQKNKNSMRKKAMDSMMKEGPAMSFKKKPAMGIDPEEMSDPEDLLDGGKDEAQEEQAEQAGYQSFMVSPEEKAMILQMRQKKKGGAVPHDPVAASHGMKGAY